jgi:hypothetical protein
MAATGRLLLALAISDLLQNNKSGIGPSKEHSNNSKTFNLSSSFSQKGPIMCSDWLKF